MDIEFISNKTDLNKEYKFSLCTPCFNSSRTIESVYNSLKALTYDDFEWIIVDDASSDNTVEIIENIIGKSDIDISFYKLKENRMVTYCYNLAVQKSQSEFLILLDHDDQISSNALERFLFHWSQVPGKNKEELAGMMSNCNDENGNLVGSLFKKSPYINGFFEVVFDDNTRGEKFFCYKTSIMKINNFPLVDRYVPESVVMWNISAYHQTLFFNESLRIYTKPVNEDRNLSFLNSFEYAVGFRFKFLQLLNNHLDKLLIRPYILVNFIYNYTVYSFASKNSLFKMFKDLNGLILKVLFLIPLPLIYCLWSLKNLQNSTNKST